jgi:hypothetical protein
MRQIRLEQTGYNYKVFVDGIWYADIMKEDYRYYMRVAPVYGLCFDANFQPVFDFLMVLNSVQLVIHKE